MGKIIRYLSFVINNKPLLFQGLNLLNEGKRTCASKSRFEKRPLDSRPATFISLNCPYWITEQL